MPAGSRVLITTLIVLLCQTVSGEVIRVEAVPGIPFGVGQIIIQIPQGIDEETLDTHIFSINEANDRIHYPAFRYTEPLGIVRELLGIPNENPPPSQLHIHFLFTGTEPLDLKLHVPSQQFVTATPRGRRPAYMRLLRSWWVRYKAAARKQRREGDYAPIVETYLTSMLAHRLNQRETMLDVDSSGQAISMLLGTEKLRLAMLQRGVHGTGERNQPLSIPLPRQISWPSADIPTVPDQVEVESLAKVVPHECFYVRFSQFANYSWLRRLLEEYGGDLSRMIMLRGTDAHLNERLEAQLGLRESSLSRVLGPQVISDIALIGRDTYLREGAAIGVLFEAKNNLLLRTELTAQRTRRVEELKAEGATIETIDIEGKDVSVASTSDHRLRSFYVEHGNYHLVTNCESIARRFIQCGKTGKGTLGTSQEFKYARHLIPTGEENTVFVYLSRRFFEGLLSPQYQIELERRLRSVTDSELLQLAKLAAQGEGHAAPSSQALVDLGFLAEDVTRRADGSQTSMASLSTDSLRGARGTYLPIPDVNLGNITVSEARRFQRTTDYYQRRWRQMDPVLLSLQRSALDDDTERVEIEAKLLPLNKDKYGALVQFFGAPTTTRIQSQPDDIVSVQAVVGSSRLAPRPHHLYFGIRDLVPKREMSKKGFLKSLQILRSAPAYIAAWPSPHILESLGLYGRPVGEGYRRLLFGLIRFDTPDGFSLLSFDQQILADVAPQLAMEQVDEAAQFHIKVGDVMQSKFGQWANDLDYQRAWETSVGNVHLLHVMAQQLRVPIVDAQRIAQSLLSAELYCPLGGEYKLVTNPDGEKRWVSSAWEHGKNRRRQEYVSPLMNWLRGLEASLTIDDDRIVAHGHLDIKREKIGGNPIKLPLFNFFGAGTEQPTNGDKSAPEEIPPPQPQPE